MNVKENQLQAAEVQLIYKSNVPVAKRVQVRTSQEAFNLLWDYWDKETIEHHEEFKILLLNNKNVVLGIAEISKGGITSTVIDPRIILQHALKTHATGIILAHNHPSSNPVPSESDVEITKRLVEAGNVMEIKVYDHIILCADGTYFSLADEGRI